jgi:hypothetical protein
MTRTACAEGTAGAAWLWWCIAAKIKGRWEALWLLLGGGGNGKAPSTGAPGNPQLDGRATLNQGACLPIAHWGALGLYGNL